jgi:hypothetical protein
MVSRYPVVNAIWYVLNIVAYKTSAMTVEYHVPSFTIDEMRTGTRTMDLLHTLQTTGMFAVPVDKYTQTAQHEEHFSYDIDTFADARDRAYHGLCRCMEDNSSKNDWWEIMNEAVDRVILPDGLTTRTTVATATVGRSNPLPLLPSLSVACGVDTIEAMDQLRDFTAIVSDAFLQSLDQFVIPIISHVTTEGAILEGKITKPLLTNQHGGEYYTFKSIVQGATNLEHFHVYKKSEVYQEQGQNDGFSLNFHTDAGLFLTFVPGASCSQRFNGLDSNNAEEAFWVRNPETGMAERARFPPNSIVVMMGMGMQEWIQLEDPFAEEDAFLLGLQHKSGFRATSHAIKMTSGTRRAWYGMSR